MSNFKEGDRVVHDYLGAGVVKSFIKSGLDGRLKIAYIVLFDKTPNIRYNMAQNPTMVFTGSLIKERVILN